MELLIKGFFFFGQAFTCKQILNLSFTEERAARMISTQINFINTVQFKIILTYLRVPSHILLTK